MKFVKEGEDAYVAVTEPSDANESEIIKSIQLIAEMSAYIGKRGFSPELRASDRAGHKRYAEVERSLMFIRNAASTALMHIEFIDFPPTESSADRSKLN